jgi:hypothetical protein
MESTDLAEIQNLPIAELTEYLAELTDSELVDLRNLEADNESPRKGALEAIDAEIAQRAPAGDGESAQSAVVVSPDKAAEPVWRKQDYTGPLTGDQAAWRHAHLKPVDVERTKPVQAIKTK